MKVALALLATLILVSFAMGQREKSVLLTGDEAKRLSKQCSRDSPSDFTNVWVPSEDDIRKMESKLSNISSLRAKCCIEGASIASPNKWYLQYAGLVWHGKRVIYIGAVGRERPTTFERDEATGTFKEVPNDNWKKFAIVICDGGNAWGVIYDPQTGKFSDLSLNGIG